MKWLLPAVVVLATGVVAAQSPFVSAVESVVHGGRQLKGLVPLEIDGKPVEKRYVLRMPSTWNGSLVIGAHGGGGGNNFDRSGKVIGTDETALDDVIGRYAISKGFVYASVDRDGSGGGRAGLALTTQFTNLVRAGDEAPGPHHTTPDVSRRIVGRAVASRGWPRKIARRCSTAR